MKYAEVNQDGIVTKVLDNNGEYYAPEDGSFLIQSEQFNEGQRYEPVAGNFPPAFALIGTPSVKNVSKKQASPDDQA